MTRIAALAIILSESCFTTVYSQLTEIHQKIEEIAAADLRISTIGGDSFDRALFILPDKGNALTVVALTYESGVGNPMLININPDLSVNWSRTYSDEGFTFWFSGAQTHDGDYLLTGFAAIEDNGLDAYLSKVSRCGSPMWTLNFGGEKHERAYKITPTQDNGFVFAGQSESWGDHNISGLVMKIGEAGDLLWDRTFGMTELNRLYSVVELDDGDLIISGITNANYPDNSDILLYRLDKDGKTIWEKRFGGPKGDIAHSLINGPDNTFLVVGYTSEKSDTLSDPHILHFDEQGELIHKYLVTTGNDVRLINGYLDQKGNYIGTGFVRETLESDWNILLFRLDFKSRKFSLNKTCISDSDEEAYHAAPLGKGRALIVGHSMGFGNGDIVLMEWKYE